MRGHQMTKIANKTYYFIRCQQPMHSSCQCLASATLTGAYNFLLGAVLNPGIVISARIT